MAKNPVGCYAVEWGQNPEAETFAESRWDAKEEALDEAQKKFENDYKCVWVGKLVREKNDWYYFWWNPGTGWGDLPPDNYGRRVARGKDVRI